MPKRCRNLLCAIAVLPFIYGGVVSCQDISKKYSTVCDTLMKTGLRSCGSYDLLRELTGNAPHRLAGSEGAAKAVELTKRMMERLGFANVHVETCLVPHWVRGSVESAEILHPGGMRPIPLSVCALGGSIATPRNGITAEIVEVRSFDELKAFGGRAKGKIVFFNRPFDPAKLNTFEGYSGAVDQRGGGAVMAAKVGGVAALVRSMTTALDDVPHTGAMGYQDTIVHIPAAAVSTMGADRLSELLKKNPHLKVRLKLTCRTLPDAPSANVIGEITGAEKPAEVIVVGGHLDCWDKGSGAHDDGSGCMQGIEVVNLIKSVGLRPKRTIRAVMFMNEENGLRGGRAYPVAPQRVSEKQIAAIESDRGGFAPRGFDVQADSAVSEKVIQWGPLFERIEAGRIRKGGSGVDISPMVQSGVPGFGLDVENQRYFDYHHSDNDTFDKVNRRELEEGAIVEALLCYLISEEGL
jgi:carboxypeptidase Q